MYVQFIETTVLKVLICLLDLQINFVCSNTLQLKYSSSIVTYAGNYKVYS